MSNQNPYYKEPEDLLDDPYPPYTPHPSSPFDAFGNVNMNYTKTRMDYPTDPWVGYGPAGYRGNGNGYTTQPASSYVGAQRDASAYAAMRPVANCRRGRMMTGVPLPTTTSTVTPTVTPMQTQAPVPLPMPMMPMPRSTTPVYAPPPVPYFKTLPPPFAPVRSPPPAYTSFNGESSKSKARTPVPKRGLQEDEEKKAGPRISRVQFDSAKIEASQSKTGNVEELKKKWLAGEREKEKRREEERQALRLRDEARREAERVSFVRERLRLERLNAKAKVTEDVAEGRVTSTTGSKKQGKGNEKEVEDVRRAFKGLSVNERQDEEEWEVLDKPDVGGVMVDDCVDSDDSDTWC